MPPKRLQGRMISVMCLHVAAPFPQNNGQAEQTVQTKKRLVKESSDHYMALFSYRTTPLPWCDLTPEKLQWLWTNLQEQLSLNCMAIYLEMFYEQRQPTIITINSPHQSGTHLKSSKSNHTFWYSSFIPTQETQWSESKTSFPCQCGAWQPCCFLVLPNNTVLLQCRDCNPLSIKGRCGMNISYRNCFLFLVFN